MTNPGDGWHEAYQDKLLALLISRKKRLANKEDTFLIDQSIKELVTKLGGLDNAFATTQEVT